MRFDIKNINSMRFMPDWNPNSGNGVNGLINLCLDIYSLNPKASKWVEIGSYIGESALIFSSFPFVKELNCVDPMILGERKDLEKCFRERLKHSEVKLHVETSEQYAKKVKNNSLHVVYIDGDHEYVSVLNDLDLWYPKLMYGGFLCGHDYMGKHKGVDQALNEFVDYHGLQIYKTYRDGSFMIRTCD